MITLGRFLVVSSKTDNQGYNMVMCWLAISNLGFKVMEVNNRKFVFYSSQRPSDSWLKYWLSFWRSPDAPIALEEKSLQPAELFLLQWPGHQGIVTDKTEARLLLPPIANQKCRFIVTLHVTDWQWLHNPTCYWLQAGPPSIKKAEVAAVWQASSSTSKQPIFSSVSNV